MPARMKAYALNTNLVVALVVRIPHDGLKESAVDSDGTTKAYLAWGVSGDHHPIRNRRSGAYAGATARAGRSGRQRWLRHGVGEVHVEIAAYSLQRAGVSNNSEVKLLCDSTFGRLLRRDSACRRQRHPAITIADNCRCDDGRPRAV